MQKKLIAVAVAVAVLLSGCATSMTAEVEDGVRKADVSSVQAMESLRAAKPVEKVEAESVRRVDKVWLPVSKVSELDYRSAPILNRVVSVNRRFANASDAAAYITSLTGIPVSVSGVPTSQTTPASTPLQPAAQGVGQGVGQGVPAATQWPTHLVSYSGRLSGLMDILAARFGLYWEPEGEGVRLFKTKSGTFRLAALPGDSSMLSSVGTQASGSSGSTGGAASSSSAEQKSGIQFTGLSVWRGVEDSIKAMLTPDGRVVVTPATGTVTVDDTPPTLERVAKFVADQNVALTRQVVLNVRVLGIELNESNSYGINWDAVYSNLGRGFGVAMSTASGLPSPTGTLTFNIVNTSSMWDGTRAMLEALSKQGKVSQITSASIVTINNQPAPIQVGRQRSYLASSTTTIGTGGAGNTTTLVPGTLMTGFSMSVLPHILDSGRLMLQYSGDISSLIELVTVSSDGSSIQVPEIDTRNFLQRVMMNTGETLVLAGFEQVNLSGSKRGIGSADNIALGGGVSTSDNRSVLVVLIQPVMSVGEP